MSDKTHNSRSFATFEILLSAETVRSAAKISLADAFQRLLPGQLSSELAAIVRALERSKT